MSLFAGLYRRFRFGKPIVVVSGLPRSGTSMVMKMLEAGGVEIITDGPRRDQIPPIHRPKFVAAAEDKELGQDEPVLGVIINGDARAYPINMLSRHEIVNDVVGGEPIAVTW